LSEGAAFGPVAFVVYPDVALASANEVIATISTEDNKSRDYKNRIAKAD
jgi:hypothetical protein